MANNKRKIRAGTSGVLSGNGMVKRYSADELENTFLYGLDVKSRVIHVYGEIDGDSHRKLLTGLSNLNTTGESPIVVMLNSEGGSILDGWGMYDAIRNSKAPVNIEVYGQALSMAAVILQAGQVRAISRGSTIMVHDGYKYEEGTPVRSSENWNEFMKKNRRRFYEIFSERTGKSVKYWEGKFTNDSLYDAERALEERIVDKIIEPSRHIPFTSLRRASI